VLLTIFFCIAQTTNEVTNVVSGTVMDNQTGEPLMYATIFFPQYENGVSTDQKGHFSFRLKKNFTNGSEIALRVSLTGYKTEDLTINNTSKEVIIKLKTDVRSLNEVVIFKQKYKRKNNPAIELISKVIENKKFNRSKSIDYFRNEKYEKIQFAINKITPDFKMKSLFKHFQFVFENIDSLNGEQVLPVYLKENISKHYFRKSPSEEKDILEAHKAVSLNGFDNRGIEDNIKYLYQDIDIYNNNVPLLSTQFLSPIASNATTFYRYYIQDTLQIGDDKFVKMYFAPRNKEDLLFQGNLYISMDGSYAIKKIELTVSKSINVNWVSDIKVVQEYNKLENKNWMLSSDLISMKFGLSKNSRGIIGQKSVYYTKFSFDPLQNDSIFKEKSLSYYDKRFVESEKYLDENRAKQLSRSEARVYNTMDSINNVPTFKHIVDAVTVLLFGYKNAGIFEIGPINTFYMYNPVEGLRLRFGGRTTDLFSKKLNLESYVAYGFSDQKAKYYLGGIWSLTDRNFQQFPVKAIKLSYQNDTQLPGQQMQFLMEDNFLLSIKRGVNDKIFYNKTFKIEHFNEFESHFSYTLGYKFTNMTPGGNLFFNYFDYQSHSNDINHLNVSEFYVNLRYAPNESFYQGKTFRIQNYNKYPIFELRYNASNKLWKSDYSYQCLRFNIRKRVFFSVFGYSDVVWEAGKIFGKVPYPLLNIPQANQSYSYQIESYNLMNFLEFATDQYTSLMVDHTFNGFFLDKIPLIGKLGLREYLTCKVLYGDVTSTNDPAKNNDLFRLPVDKNGVPITSTLGKTPYIEGSVGIGNIFKLFRVDLVKRFTYLNNPNVSEWGVRMRFRLDF